MVAHVESTLLMEWKLSENLCVTFGGKMLNVVPLAWLVLVSVSVPNRLANISGLKMLVHFIDAMRSISKSANLNLMLS